MGTRFLLTCWKASKHDTGLAKIPRLGDVVASRREKVSFTSCRRKAGLRHADILRLPRLGVIFYFLVDVGFYFLL